MLSREILQKTLDGNKEISGAELCLTDKRGAVLAATCGPDADELTLLVQPFAESESESRETRGWKLLKVRDGAELEYVLAVGAGKAAGDSVGKMIVFQLQSLLTAYRDCSGRESFLQNLMRDNLLPADISEQARRLQIEENKRRVVYCIETPEEMRGRMAERLRGLFAARGADFLTAEDGKTVIFIKELEEREGLDEIEKTAVSLRERLREEAGPFRVSFGTVARQLRELPRSRKEAGMAMEIGKIFYKEREIIPYGALGIGRLIYQLPLSLCAQFAEEIFREAKPEELGGELLNTISKFFSCSLNISETARQLYIHRNTLVYRLDKVEKQTGLDVRTFEGAIAFQIGQMVLNYRKEMETAEL